MKRSRIGASVFAATLALAAQAGANVLSPTSKTLGAGSAAVSSCGALSSVTTSWNSTAGNVTSVTVSGIPAGCVGGDLSVTLRSSTGAALGGGGPLAVTGSSLTFSALTAQPAASSVVDAALAETGP